MRVAANLNVLDEVELIDRCIQHLRAIGVDIIVATDLGSIDGTLELLEEHAREENFFLIRLRREEDPWGFPAQMYEKTLAEFEVDRVLFLDADEFWLPQNGRLKDTDALARVDALSVRRLNVPVVAGHSILPADLSPANYRELYLVANPLPDAEARFRESSEPAWITTQVARKTLVNPAVVQGVGMGAHFIVEKSEANATVATPDDLIIAHVPFSTSERFLRKLVNIERSLTTFGHRLEGSEAWHWRRWLKLAKEGRGGEEFQRQLLSEAGFRTAIAEDTIQSAEEVFLRWKSN